MGSDTGTPQVPESYDADRRRQALELIRMLGDDLPDWGWNRWVVVATLEYEYCDNDARALRQLARDTYTPGDEFDEARFSGSQHTYRWHLTTPMCSPAEAGRLASEVKAALPNATMFSPDAPTYRVEVVPYEWDELDEDTKTVDTLPLGNRRHTRAGEVFAFPRRRRGLTSEEMLGRLEEEGVEAFMRRWGPALRSTGREPLVVGDGALLVPRDRTPDWDRPIPDDFQVRAVTFEGGIDPTAPTVVFPFERGAVIVSGDAAVLGAWSRSTNLRSSLRDQWRREVIEPRYRSLPLIVRVGGAEVPCWDPRNGTQTSSMGGSVDGGTEAYEMDVVFEESCTECGSREFTIGYIWHRRRTGYTRWEGSERFVAGCRQCGTRYEAFERDTAPMR